MKGSKKRIFFGIWNLDELASIIGAKLPYRVRYWNTTNMIQDTKPKLPHFATYHVDSLVANMPPPDGYIKSLGRDR